MALHVHQVHDIDSLLCFVNPCELKYSSIRERGGTLGPGHCEKCMEKFTVAQTSGRRSQNSHRHTHCPWLWTPDLAVLSEVISPSCVSAPDSEWGVCLCTSLLSWHSHFKLTCPYLRVNTRRCHWTMSFPNTLCGCYGKASRVLTQAFRT